MRTVLLLGCLVSCATLAACSPVRRASTVPPATTTESAESESGAVFTTVIHQTMPSYRFEMKWSDNTVNSIVVSRLDGPMPAVVQTISVPESNLYLPEKPQSRSDFFTTEDLNFDGFKDIKLLAAYGAYGGTETYNAWFFNPKAGMFVYHPEFTTIVSPQVDDKTHHILSYGCGRAPCDVHDFRSYDYQNGKISLVRHERQDVHDASSSEFSRTVMVRTGSNMQKVCSITLTADGAHHLVSGSLQNCGALKPSATGEWTFTD